MYTANEVLDKVNTYIAKLPIMREPEGLYMPIDYVMGVGGKRIRPVLMLMAYNLYKEDVTPVLPAAAAIEMYHNFTLLHDDLMDKADMRRGKATVHDVWDDNTAILSGDAMLIMSYQYIASVPQAYLKQMLDLFNVTTLEVCDGQQYDVDFEERNEVATEEYIEMIRLKTAVLLAASLKMGAIQGDASSEDADLLYDFGINIGMAFQLKDDLLDVYGDPTVFGKNIGGDILCNKKTYMLLKTRELASDEERRKLNKCIRATRIDPQEKIAAVVAIYDKVGIKTVCENKMQEYYDNAIRSLEKVSVTKEKKNELITLVHDLMYREH